MKNSFIWIIAVIAMAICGFFGNYVCKINHIEHVESGEEQTDFEYKAWKLPIDGLNWGMTKQQAGEVRFMHDALRKNSTGKDIMVMDTLQNLFGQEMEVELYFDPITGLEKVVGTYQAETPGQIECTLEQLYGTPIKGQNSVTWDYGTVSEILTKEEVRQRYLSITSDPETVSDYTVSGAMVAPLFRLQLNEEADGTGQVMMSASEWLFFTADAADAN